MLHHVGIYESIQNRDEIYFMLLKHVLIGVRWDMVQNNNMSQFVWSSFCGFFVTSRQDMYALMCGIKAYENMQKTFPSQNKNWRWKDTSR